MAANTLNFLMIATHAFIVFGVPLRLLGRSFVTALPSQFATALLTAGVAFTYGHLGMGSIGLAAVILFVFLYIVRTSVQAQERGEELTHARASSRRCRWACCRRCCRRSRCATR